MDWYVTYGDGTHVVDETPEFQFGEDDALLTLGYFAGSGRNRYDFCGEGDTPTYLSFFNTGLGSLDKPEWGSYTGRFLKDEDKAAKGFTNYYSMARDTLVMSDWANVGETTEAAAYDSSARWVTDIMNDFAARVEWGVYGYEDANRAPAIEVVEGGELTAAAGETVYLNAIVSDPDGDDVRVHWFSYPEAGTLEAELIGENPGYRTSFTVPENAQPGDTIHILAKAIDDGAHTLAHYQRMVVTVGE